MTEPLEDAPPETPPPAPAVEYPPIDVGWVILGPLDDVDREAVAIARERFVERLREDFPHFSWSLNKIERTGPAPTGEALQVEPVRLLELGEAEREARRWDFAFVLTGSDLASRYRRFALATPSRALGVAVLSTLRLDPAHPTPGQRRRSREDRTEVLARRLVALTLHLFGHLNGLEHDAEPGLVMYDITSQQDLDADVRWCDEDHEKLTEELEDVADPRLEEAVESRRLSRLAFLWRAVWRNRDDVWSAVRHAKPWRFPVQLSKLTTAAGSTLLILILTAEAWDLGMSQPTLRVVLMALTVLVVTTGYVMERQKLLRKRGAKRRLSEQGAVTRLALTLTVAVGLATTFSLLFAVTLLLSLTFFPTPLVSSWASAAIGDAPTAVWHNYLSMAGFVASLGLIIGALGASFEEQHYFRHIAYVDEET